MRTRSPSTGGQTRHDALRGGEVREASGGGVALGDGVEIDAELERTSLEPRRLGFVVVRIVESAGGLPPGIFAVETEGGVQHLARHLKRRLGARQVDARFFVERLLGEVLERHGVARVEELSRHVEGCVRGLQDGAAKLEDLLVGLEPVERNARLVCEIEGRPGRPQLGFLELGVGDALLRAQEDQIRDALVRAEVDVGSVVAAETEPPFDDRIGDRERGDEPAAGDPELLEGRLHLGVVQQRHLHRTLCGERLGQHAPSHLIGVAATLDLVPMHLVARALLDHAQDVAIARSTRDTGGGARHGDEHREPCGPALAHGDSFSSSSPC